ncbi:MAG: GNAT family N-acetyltransferase [Bdellovibrionota bacterium]
MYIYFQEIKKNKTHAKRIMEWRNDPTTLKMFYHSTPKTWKSFWEEYQNEYFKTDPLLAHFAYMGDNAIAFIRSTPYFDKGISGKVFDIDVNLDRKYRGKGLGSLIINNYASLIFKLGATKLIAEVKKINTASIKAFENAGFTYLDEKTKEIGSQRIPIFRFMKKKAPLKTSKKSAQTFIIAEAGSNWRLGHINDSNGEESFIEVAEAGATAVKFQTYRSKTVYVPNAGQANYLSQSGEKRDINEIFDDLSMPYELYSDFCRLCAAMWY